MTIRLVLFDIDGTLLWPGPVPKQCLAEALKDVFGTRGDIERYPFGGKTDPQIVSDLMTEAGMSEPDVVAKMPFVFELYLRLLRERLTPLSMELYPGTRPLLHALSRLSGVALGLVTGNIEPGATVKLSQFDLNCFFRVGAYGSDSADRNNLPELARRRAESALCVSIAPDQAVVVGDSVYDVRCARACGTKAVAVATGRTSLEALVAEGPDVTLKDFNDTEEVVASLVRV